MCLGAGQEEEEEEEDDDCGEPPPYDEVAAALTPDEAASRLQRWARDFGRPSFLKLVKMLWAEETRAEADLEVGREPQRGARGERAKARASQLSRSHSMRAGLSWRWGRPRGSRRCGAGTGGEGVWRAPHAARRLVADGPGRVVEPV